MNTLREYRTAVIATAFAMLTGCCGGSAGVALWSSGLGPFLVKAAVAVILRVFGLQVIPEGR